jgi:hypothetical protein
MAKIESYLLNLAGEYRICSELNKRDVFATVTYGNRKGVDVYAIGDRKKRTYVLKIEVKTSQHKNFVTMITQKHLNDDPHAPDFWVLFQIQRNKERFLERFFVLTHKEICQVQRKINKEYAKKYRARNGKNPDLTKGVDSVTVDSVKDFKNKWDKIIKRLGG